MPSTSGNVNVPHSGRRSVSVPPGNALAPPAVPLPTYPSSTLNKYYSHPASFTSNNNNAHISAVASPIFYDPNAFPPSASQFCVLSLRRTPSSPLHSLPGTRSPHSQTEHRSHSAHLSPLIFQSPSPMSPNQPTFNVPQPRRHSIFSPPIIPAPLPDAAYISPAISHHSAHLPAPNLVQPVPFLLFTHNAFPLTNNNFFPDSPASNNSHHNPSSHSSPSVLKLSLPSTKDIPLLTGKHD